MQLFFQGKTVHTDYSNWGMNLSRKENDRTRGGEDDRSAFFQVAFVYECLLCLSSSRGFREFKKRKEKRIEPQPPWLVVRGDLTSVGSVSFLLSDFSPSGPFVYIYLMLSNTASAY